MSVCLSVVQFRPPNLYPDISELCPTETGYSALLASETVSSDNLRSDFVLLPTLDFICEETATAAKQKNVHLCSDIQLEERSAMPIHYFCFSICVHSELHLLNPKMSSHNCIYTPFQ